MRVAVISDIHGNCVALDAALADLEKRSVDKIVCLGDAIQGGPQPVETISRLRRLACPVVMGNSDDWLLKDETSSVEPTTPEQREVRKWTLSKLSREDLLFIKTFRPTVRVQLGGNKDLLCFHGSPTSYDEILLPTTPEKAWDLALGKHEHSILTGGHTHLQQLHRFGEDGLFFNPGSVGVVLSPTSTLEIAVTDSWAEYAILSSDSHSFSVEYRRAPYDPQQLFHVVRNSKRPYADKMISGYRH